MKVFIIEYSGCEFGGAEHAAFDSLEKAEQYVAQRDEEQGYPRVVDHFEIIEVEVQ